MMPKLDDLSSLDLVRLADNPQDNVSLMIVQRLVDGKPLTTRLTAGEIAWLTSLAMTGGIIKQMLMDLDIGDIAQAWAAKQKRSKKPRGRRDEFIYVLAWSVLKLGDREPMEIYRDIVLPALIELGQVQVDDNGEPDPHQDLIEQKNFLKAMARRRNTPRK